MKNVMTAQGLERRPLGALGISEAEENSYRWLLTHPGTTTAEMAQGLTSTPGETRRLLDAIETKGLVTSTPERPRRYFPVSPDIAIKALALQSHQTVQRAEDMIPELQEQAAARPRDKQELMVELITSHEAEQQTFEQMNRLAQREVLSFLRSPIRISRLEASQDYDTQKVARARGVHYRVILDAEYLALDGAVHRTREDVRAGEEIRVVPHLPLKMVLVDRRIALIPLNLEQSDSPVLLVRSSALLDTLYAMFEILWRQASPISFSRSGVLETGVSGVQLSRDDSDLIMLFAAGLNDKKIADELGISTRTLNRRLVEITKVLGARSRFQMGWLAALRFHENRETETSS